MILCIKLGDENAILVLLDYAKTFISNVGFLETIL